MIARTRVSLKLVAKPSNTRLEPRVGLVADAATARYGFPNSHPFGVDRQDAFLREAQRQGLINRVSRLASREASVDELQRFHTLRHIERVQRGSRTGEGALDGGDTPAFAGCHEAAASVVGATLTVAEAIMNQDCDRGFVPIAGLHHASRDAASGFCIYNDCGVLIETLRSVYGLQRVAYIDIDAHHGDGVYYAFEADPFLVFADTHEDGQFLYPGTGASGERGKGLAEGLKLNVPLPPGADDAQFGQAWSEIMRHLRGLPADFYILQCGADSVLGDPLTHLALTPAAHAGAAADLCALAQANGHGRVLALGGGGYHHRNLAQAWSAVLAALLQA